MRRAASIVASVASRGVAPPPGVRASAFAPLASRRAFASDAREPVGSTRPGMAFASGLSKRESLSHAVVEAVAEVKATLGHDVVPTWVQLMVSADYDEPELAPAYALECFTPPRASASSSPSSSDAHPDPTPALFGGVVSGCIGGRGQVMDGPSVSVTAAVMPGVEAIPFHTPDASLPSLTPEQWVRVIRASRRRDDPEPEPDQRPRPRPSTSSSASSSSRDSVAALVLADADFVDVDDLARRLHFAAPGSVVLGGSAKPGGAIFSGARATHEGGAAGVILRGPFTLEHHSLHSCRPVGPPMTLTRASDGMVMELDGVSAGDALTRLLANLPKADAGLPVMLGVGEAPRVPTGSEGVGFRSEGTTDDEAAAAAAAAAARKRAREYQRGRVHASLAGRLRGRVVDDGEEKQMRARATSKTNKEERVIPSGFDEDSSESSERFGSSSSAAAAAAARAVASFGAGGDGYVYRDIMSADHETGGVYVGRHALEVGAPVQLHVRDAEWGRERARELLRRLAAEAGTETGTGTWTGTEPSSASLAGAVMFTCESGANRLQAANFRDAVPGVALGGGYVAGELAPARAASQSFLQSHTSALGVFRHPKGSGT